jgi:hypothetical protein
MKIKSIVMLFGCALFGFAVVSCDSRNENVREDMLEDRADSQENAAEAVRENAEKAADAKEDAADATREKGEQKADALENAADSTREKQ